MLLAHRASSAAASGGTACGRPWQSALPHSCQPTPLHNPHTCCMQATTLHGQPACSSNSSSRATTAVASAAASPSTAAASSTVAPTPQQQKVADEVEKSIPADLPEAEKERLRRERISQANKGKATWNKGRKHRPETIAKIKAKTAEAMLRKEVVDAYKSSMEPILAEKRAKAEARKAAEQERKKQAAEAAAAARAEKAAAKAAAAAQARAEAAALREAARVAAAEERARNPKPKVKKTAVQREGETSNGEASTSEVKRRQQYTDEHRKRISEAIRAKWQDARYREKTVAAINAERETREKPLRPPRPRSSSSSSSSRSSGSSSGTSKKKPSRAAQPSVLTREQLVKEKLAQLQLLIRHISSSQDLVARTDMQLEATRLKVQAFENDPHMASKARHMVSNVEAMLNSTRAKLAGFMAQLPPGTKFDRQGGISFDSPEAAEALMQWSLPGAPSTTTLISINSSSSNGSSAGAPGNTHSTQHVNMSGSPPPGMSMNGTGSMNGSTLHSAALNGRAHSPEGPFGGGFGGGAVAGQPSSNGVYGGVGDNSSSSGMYNGGPSLNGSSSSNGRHGLDSHGMGAWGPVDGFGGNGSAASNGVHAPSNGAHAGPGSSSNNSSSGSESGGVRPGHTVSGAGGGGHHVWSGLWDGRVELRDLPPGHPELSAELAARAAAVSPARRSELEGYMQGVRDGGSGVIGGEGERSVSGEGLDGGQPGAGDGSNETGVGEGVGGGASQGANTAREGVHADAHTSGGGGVDDEGGEGRSEGGIFEALDAQQRARLQQLQQQQLQQQAGGSTDAVQSDSSSLSHTNYTAPSHTPTHTPTPTPSTDARVPSPTPPPPTPTTSASSSRATRNSSSTRVRTQQPLTNTTGSMPVSGRGSSRGSSEAAAGEALGFTPSTRTRRARR